jgi:Fe-S oxidoreductase
MWNEEKCNLCGDCLTRCHYVDYDRDKAVRQIEELMAGKAAEILKACVTCCACNEYCPTGANPFDLISRLQEVHGSLPIPEKMRHFMDAGATMPSAVIPGDPDKPALSLCAMEWALPKGAVGGSMFDGMTVAKGGDYFCYLGYLHIGMDSPLKANARKFVDAIAGIGSGEVVFLHADCHAMINKVPEYGVEVPFKGTHIVEFMRDYLKAHPEKVTPLGRKIAYQRPCASRYSGEVEPALDELFGLIGVERLARRYDRESALCCGGMGMRLDPKRTLPFVEGNIQDALDAGAEAMVFLCPLCPGALAKPAKEKGMQPIFITELVRMALGELPFPS